MSAISSNSFNNLKVELNVDKWVNANKNHISICNYNDSLKINSCLKNTSFEYIQYETSEAFNNPSIVNFKNISENNIFLVDFIGEDFLNNSSDLFTELFIIGYSDTEKLQVDSIKLNNTKYVYVKAGVKKIRIAIRISGSGETYIKKIDIKVFSKRESSLIQNYIIGEFDKQEDKYLVLTNIYPSLNNLYRNAFVHRRVLLYKEKGLNIDVFSLGRVGDGFGKYEFQGVKIFTGDRTGLTNLLKCKNYKKILIHFVNKTMIDAIWEADPKIPLLVWIHGFETERWYRRWFNYDFSQKDMDKIKDGLAEDNKKIEFMRSLYTNKDNQTTFIFVSQWFKENVAEEDTNCKIINSEIIPNVIDDGLFKFHKKDKEKRKKILSIRPFSSRKYANDLSIKAILELSQKDFFYDLEFAIYGEGALFKEITNPIKHFKNVTIVETFLRQEQIAELHKQYGIFLCPTRLDSQGVSMCEAMSSGLVPIATDITAIPEFVKNNCGILSKAEDYKGLAQGIEYLYKNPDRFIEMSYNSSQYIQQKCSRDQVISEEVQLILNEN